MSLTLATPADVLNGVRERFRQRRIAMNLTQEGLARRAGMGLPSLRRFERTGLIAFDSLLKLALVLECLGDFETVGAETDQAVAGRSLDEILSEKPKRQKGRRK